MMQPWEKLPTCKMLPWSTSLDFVTFISPFKRERRTMENKMQPPRIPEDQR